MTTPQIPATRKKTRASKEASGTEKIVKEKFAEEKKVPPLTAKTGNQKIALNYFAENRQLVLLCGAAGTGKSLLSAWKASSMLKSNKVSKIILVRPMVSTANSLAALPGSVKDKLSPALAPIISHLERFLGKEYCDYSVDKNIIEMMPLEFLRGASFENSVVIAEEIQNCTPDEVMSLVTRIGEGSFLYITGDKKQNDLKGQVTGIEYLQKLITKYSVFGSLDEASVNQFVSNTGIVEFTNDDVVRSGLTSAFVKAFNKEGV